MGKKQGNLKNVYHIFCVGFLSYLKEGLFMFVLAHVVRGFSTRKLENAVNTILSIIYIANKFTNEKMLSKRFVRALPSDSFYINN
jgi:hypothetical protein